MNSETFRFFLVFNIFIVIILVMAFIIYMMYKGNKSTKMKMQSFQASVVQNNSKCNFELDSVFLMYIMETKIKKIESEVLVPLKASKNMSINQSVYEECLNRALLETIFEISDDYKQVMMKYFTEQGLYNFVAQKISDAFLGQIVAQNMNITRVEEK